MGLQIFIYEGLPVWMLQSTGFKVVNKIYSLQGALEDFDTTTPSTTNQTSQVDSQNGAKSLDCTKRTETKACEKSSDTTAVKTQGSTSATASPQDTLDHARLEANLGQVPGLDELENAMKTMLGNEPELLAQLEQFAQAAASTDHGKMENNLLGAGGRVVLGKVALVMFQMKI